MSHSGAVSSVAATQAGRSKVRFETLDSWRGICALIVAMMHFPVSGWLAENAVVRNGYLFVDYFFVLSGVVIAHGYGDRIADGASFRRFMMLRWGRVYPLHLAVLLLFIGFEIARMVVPALRGDGPAPFTDGNSLSGLVSSLLLLNGTGLEDSLVWNGPSWSISSEFWTYVLFGGALIALRDRIWLALVPAIFVSPIVLALGSTEYMDTTWAFGLIRCIYGFSLGVLIYLAMRPRLSGTVRPGTDWRWTAAEVAAVIGVGLFVALAGRNSASFAAPFVFGAALIVFMHEGGLVSRLLRMRAFLFLGTLSYGIYMLHIFIQSRLINAGTLAGKVTGHDFVGPFEIAGEPFYGFGLNGAAFGTAMMLVMIVVVIAAAWFGNVLVERPFQRWTRRLVERNDARRAHHEQRYSAAIGGLAEPQRSLTSA